MASATSVLQGDYFINGNLAAKTQSLPAGSVQDSTVAGLAGIQAAKLQHQHEPVTALCPNGTSAAAVREVIHVVAGATGQIVSFSAGATVAATSSGTATVDLKKNGSTVLTATISLTSSVAAFALVAAAGYTSTALVAGDILEAEITAVSGSAVPKGVFAALVVREDAQ